MKITLEIQWERRLREWRAARAKLEHLPRYRILTDKTLQAIAAKRPRTLTELAEIPGIGVRKLAQFGPTLLGLGEVLRNETPAPDPRGDSSRTPPSA